MDLDADAGDDAEAPLVAIAPQGDVASTEEDGQCVRLVDLLHGEFELLMNLSVERRERLQTYQRRLQTYQFSVILIQDAPIDVATEIFTRINVSGQPLSVFEIMVAKTYDQESGFDLAERYRTLQTRLETVDYGTVPPAALLQLASLLVNGQCQKQDILRLNTAEFRKKWMTVEEAVEAACDYFRSYFRIPVSKLLPYAALIVPFGYYFAKAAGKEPKGDQRRWMRELFWRISLSGRYTSALETKLAVDVKRVETVLEGQEPDYEGLDLSLTADSIESDGYFNTGRSFIKAILCLYAYQQPESFASGAKVRVANDWLKRANSKNYHHFFPRAYLERRDYTSWYINHIANITIVDDYLNKRVIRAKAPSVYMKAFRKENPHLDDTMKTHLIDLDAFGVWEDDYDRFFRERCKVIARRLRAWIPKRTIDAGGIRPRDEDYDPNDLSPGDDLGAAK